MGIVVMGQSYAEWQAGVISGKITKFIGWLNKHNARVIGNLDGQITLALDNEDFEKMRDEIFKEENNETSEKEAKG